MNALNLTTHPLPKRIAPPLTALLLIKMELETVLLFPCKSKAPPFPDAVLLIKIEPITFPLVPPTHNAPQTSLVAELLIKTEPIIVLFTLLLPKTTAPTLGA